MSFEGTLQVACCTSDSNSQGASQSHGRRTHRSSIANWRPGASDWLLVGWALALVACGSGSPATRPADAAHSDADVARRDQASDQPLAGDRPAPLDLVELLADVRDLRTDTAEVVIVDAVDIAAEVTADLPADLVDVDAVDVCVPDCTDKECGTDGCGGSCGECFDAHPCTLDWCDETTGSCHYDSIPCPPVEKCPAGPCEELLFEPETGLYRVETTCTSEDPCMFAICNQDGSCSFTERCPAGICETTTCNPLTGKCGIQPKCQAPDVCHTASCDADTGECTVQPKCIPNACQTASCDSETGVCLYLPITCDDGDPCTHDWCQGDTGCRHDPACCTEDEDCEDFNFCTFDKCMPSSSPIPATQGHSGWCRHTPGPPDCCYGKTECMYQYGPPPANGSWDVKCLPGGDANGGYCGFFWGSHCIDASHCDDKKTCTLNSCVNSGCLFTEVPGCCKSDEDCPFGAPEVMCMNLRCAYECPECLADDKACTNDFCDPQSGVVTHLPSEEEGALCTCASPSYFPDCGEAECGPDGCGQWCGYCQPGLEACVDGKCVCVPDCHGRQCGDDECGGTCGECGPGLVCINGLCGPPGWCGNGSCEAAAAEDAETCPADCEG